MLEIHNIFSVVCYIFGLTFFLIEMSQIYHTEFNKLLNVKFKA